MVEGANAAARCASRALETSRFEKLNWPALDISQRPNMKQPRLSIAEYNSREAAAR